MFVALAGSLKRQHASKAAGFAAVAIVAAAFIGWWAGLPLLSSWGLGFAHTRPVTALCLAALGLALVHPGKNSRFAFAVGLVVAAVATLDLFDFGIDRWLTPWAAVPEYGAASFPMPHATALALALAGGSLALSRFERHRLAATVLAGIAGTIAVLALLGYMVGIVTLNGSASVNSPALPTVVGLLCVAGGIIFRIATIPPLSKPRPCCHVLGSL